MSLPPDPPFVLHLKKSAKSFIVNDGDTALAVLLRNGIDIPYTCRWGTCGSCVTRVVSGIPLHRDAVLSDSMRESNEYIALCVSRAQTPELTIDL
jgi:vanillate O-demethylase ferredoxin subunit